MDGAWRQMAIIQGEGLELSEVPRQRWSGLTHPGRLRFQTFRPGHGEPLTDTLIGQGMMSVGGGGFGGGGLPYPSEVLQLWGGVMQEATIPVPAAPTVVKDDGSRAHDYAIIAVGAQGRRTKASRASRSQGLATLRWESVPGETPTSSSAMVRSLEARSGSKRPEGMDRHGRAVVPR